VPVQIKTTGAGRGEPVSETTVVLGEQVARYREGGDVLEDS